MKKFLLSITFFLACIISTHAQTLYGLTPYGGNDGWGALIKFIPATNNLTVAKSFEGYPANPFYTNFIQASDGKLYGMTRYGGNRITGGAVSNGGGAIFSFDLSSSTYTRLKDFDGTNGANPLGSLVQASDGKLYGMTYEGGSSNAGVIFSFDPASSTYTKLKDFDYTDGANPYGGLMQASNGKLYGMTFSGGINSYGVIFSFDPSTSNYTKLSDFDYTNGAGPHGNLMQAGDGNLYGMTSGGGSGSGVIFSFDPSTSIYTKLKDFDYTNGANPYGNLLQASDGKLYGMTAGGGSSGVAGGVIFSFDPSTSTYTKLKNFDGTNGANPYSSLTQASDGKLYGMTSKGGSGGPNNDYGVIFSFDPLSSTYTKLKDFDGTNGLSPYGSLMQASNGKLYGMTIGGGGSGYGVIFSFDPSAATYAKLKDFEATNGQAPSASLMRASDGKFYGMTTGGGSSGNGVIFSFDPSTSIYTKLKDFDRANGANPYGSLMQASNGKLYGMTAGGGSNGYGVIFSFDPSTSIYTKLQDFDGFNAANPYGSLMQGSDGKLYGMTSLGVNNDIGLSQGVIFSFDLSNSVFTKLKAFDVADGSIPYGSLMQASDGKLYGMTTQGGSSGGGVIFSFDPLSSTYTKLKDFDDNDGLSPYGSLVQANDGKLYGMTLQGGGGGYGVIFSFDPNTSIYTKLKDFDGINGAAPYGNLMQASDGKLYGMTSDGGSGGVNNYYGVIFSFDPSTSTYTKLQDFDITNGAYPYFGTVFIAVNGTLPVTLTSFTGKNNGSNNRLSWKVENEQDLNYYELQRSTDGKNFSGIAQIKATGNNTYTYNDPIAATVSSTYYYRLKIVDNDGSFKYSSIIELTFPNAGASQIVVAPNPFSNSTTISFSLPQSQKVSINIYDLNGRLVKALANNDSPAGTHQLTWNARDEKGNAVKAGIYFLRFETGSYSETKKLWVVK